MKRIYPSVLAILSLFIILSSCQKGSDGQNTSNQSGEVQAISLDGKKLYAPQETAESQQRKDSLLAIAKANYDRHPYSLDHVIWYGRRIAYLSRYKEAIEIYTKGMERHPNSPALYRHRGHRYISIREFDKAIADFKKAAELVADRAVVTEPDGIPNKLNKPLSTLQFNIWYHWALAWYLKGDFEKAAELYNTCMIYSSNPDLLCATSDWLYMTYRRIGDNDRAASVLENITEGMEIIENHSYYNRLLFYKGLKEADELLDLDNTNPENQLDIVTQGYGVGNWYLYNNRPDKAKEIFQKVVASDYWPAFGYIAAEADLTRMNN
jgi:tetratricopeptide (TPR) repeat protein